MLLQKKMRKEAKYKDESKNSSLNKSRKDIASLSKENKKLISKNVSLILKKGSIPK